EFTEVRARTHRTEVDSGRDPRAAAASRRTAAFRFVARLGGTGRNLRPFGRGERLHGAALGHSPSSCPGNARDPCPGSADVLDPAVCEADRQLEFERPEEAAADLVERSIA